MVYFHLPFAVQLLKLLQIATIIVAVAFSAMTNAWSQEQAGLHGLGDLPGGKFQSRAFAISGDGEFVVGTSTTEDGEEGFRYEVKTKKLVSIGDLPGGSVECHPSSISGDGSTVVGWGHTDEGNTGFKWTQEKGLVPLGDLGGGEFSLIRSQATGISRNGKHIVGVAGTIKRNDFGRGFNRYEAFLMSGDKPMQGLGSPIREASWSSAFAVSDDANFIGGMSEPSDRHVGLATCWLEASRSVLLPQLRDVPIGAYSRSIIYATNPSGTAFIGENCGDSFLIVVDGFKGSDASPKPGLHVFERFDDQRPGSAFALADDAHLVVGSVDSQMYQKEAFVWSPKDGSQRLAKYLATKSIDTKGWILNSAQGISADGRRIVGYGTNPEGEEEAFLVILP